MLFRDPINRSMILFAPALVSFTPSPLPSPPSVEWGGLRLLRVYCGFIAGLPN